MNRYFQTLSVNLDYFSNNEIIGISRYRLNILDDLKLDIAKAMLTENDYKRSTRVIEDEMSTIIAIMQTIS